MLNRSDYTRTENNTVYLSKESLLTLTPKIKAVALAHWPGYVDQVTNELDTTGLGEWIAATLDLYTPDSWSDIPSDVFDLVLTIETRLIKSGKVSDPINPKDS